MSNKSNIFSVLPQDHSEDEDNNGGQQSRNAKKTNNKTNTGRAEAKPAQGQKTQDRADKDDHKKNKKVPEPGTHPLDRHSGTGNAAFDKKSQKKGGHGKGNVGVATKETEEETKVEEGAEGEEKQEEQKPEGITLEEYYATTQSASQSAVDEAKLKAVQEELKKEILSKKGTLYVKKTAEEEKPVSKKTAKANVDHHAAFNSEHADLLNFRTGFVEREFKERKEGERTERPAPRPKREEKTEEAPATEGEKVEGEQAPAEGEKAEGEKRGKGNYRGNNNRGGKGYQGGNKGGNRGGNYHGGNKGGNQPKINFEDDSAFPKLG